MLSKVGFIRFSSDPLLMATVDAEECYGAIINSLRNVPGLSAEGTSIGSSAQTSAGSGRFVQQYMHGVMRRELSCDEAPEEPKTVQEETVLKVECNISVSTNFMFQGLMSVRYSRARSFKVGN